MFTFVEAPIFTKLIGEYLSDAEYAALQQALSEDPELGDVIPRSGGVRKVRWRSRGRGKRGGVRVIYFVHKEPGVIWLLTIYSKNVPESISPNVLRQIRKEIEDE